MHSAQGVTADTAHAVLGESTTRALVYVAMTRGRESNTAYFHQRMGGEADHEHRGHDHVHHARRGSSRDAAHLLRDIVSTRDERARTAHDVSAATAPHHLPEPVASVVNRRAKAHEQRGKNYLKWQEQNHTATPDNAQWRKHHLTRTSNPDRGIEL